MLFDEFQRILKSYMKGFTSNVGRGENKSSLLFSQAGELAKTRRGFTFIETLIAVSILALALTGTLSIISRSAQSSIASRDQIVAFYLAQEAVEYIQNKRSSNVLEGSDWLTGLEDCIPGPCAIWIDGAANIQIRPNGNCLGQLCQPLKFDGSIYNHNPPSGGNIESPFSREVSISTYDYDGMDPPKDEMLVSVTIKQSGNIEREFTIRHSILNRQ